jgi:hypothetical protein
MRLEAVTGILDPPGFSSSVYNKYGTQHNLIFTDDFPLKNNNNSVSVNEIFLLLNSSVHKILSYTYCHSYRCSRKY